jgi:hypothetical protein
MSLDNQRKKPHPPTQRKNQKKTLTMFCSAPPSAKFIIFIIFDIFSIFQFINIRQIRESNELLAFCLFEFREGQTGCLLSACSSFERVKRASCCHTFRPQRGSNGLLVSKRFVGAGGQTGFLLSHFSSAERVERASCCHTFRPQRRSSRFRRGCR